MGLVSGAVVLVAVLVAVLAVVPATVAVPATAAVLAAVPVTASGADLAEMGSPSVPLTGYCGFGSTLETLVLKQCQDSQEGLPIAGFLHCVAPFLLCYQLLSLIQSKNSQAVITEDAGLPYRPTGPVIKHLVVLAHYQEHQSEWPYLRGQ